MSDTDTVTVTFDAYNVNWSQDPVSNMLFVRGVLQHMSQVLSIQGHVFLNEIFDVLWMPRTRFGQTHGWAYSKDVPHPDVVLIQKKDSGDIQLDFRSMTDILDQLP